MRNVLMIFVLTFVGMSPIFAQSTLNTKPLIAVMVSDDFYNADTLLPKLMQQLAKENNWEIAIVHGHGTPNFENIEAIDKADVLVVYIRRFALPTGQMEKIKKFAASGRGIVALRTTSHGFHPGTNEIAPGFSAWTAFDKEVLGCSYHGHSPNDTGCDVKNVAEQTDSSIMKNVQPHSWHSESSLYFVDPMKEGVTVYQTGSVKDKTMPVTWTRMFGKTRIAYTSLGHQKDFEVPAFQTLLCNMVEWTRSTRSTE